MREKKVIIRGNQFIDTNRTGFNRHLVFYSDDVRDNCYITDPDAPDVKTCLTCRNAGNKSESDEWPEMLDDVQEQEGIQ